MFCQATDVAPDQTMLVTIEIMLAQQVGDLVPRTGIQQDATQHRLLCLDRVGRQLKRFELWIGYGGREVLHDVAANFGKRILHFPDDKKGLSPALFLNYLTALDYCSACTVTVTLATTSGCKAIVIA